MGSVRSGAGAEGGKRAQVALADARWHCSQAAPTRPQLPCGHKASCPPCGPKSSCPAHAAWEQDAAAREAQGELRRRLGSVEARLAELEEPSRAADWEAKLRAGGRAMASCACMHWMALLK